jgi:hypothetical protein
MAGALIPVDVVHFVRLFVVLGHHDLADHLTSRRILVAAPKRVPDDVKRGVRPKHLERRFGTEENLALVLTDGCNVAGPKL